ncbi:hypothetical protein F8M41_007831 [Gigaspora margarita]|uniref:Uncharacterized protein n=1 Tax=Gigaspora margarita TaxID=4874 RepID=A0A8H4AW85_GIGMA|nr:hypothetical protein F8M41_007831 [Gigaspora margarita]
MITEQREIANEQQLRRAISTQRPNPKRPEKLLLPNKINLPSLPKSPIGFKFPGNWAAAKQQQLHRPKTPSSLRNSVDIAQEEIDEILKTPTINLEEGQALLPPRNRGFSPIRKQDKRTYITYDKTLSMYDPKKLRQYTPSLLSKFTSQPSHDEIANELESKRFWNNSETSSKEEYYVPGGKIKIDKTSSIPIQALLKEEHIHKVKEEGFGISTSEDEVPKEESDNEEETDLHIRLNHIHPYTRKKIVSTIIRDQK